MKTTLIEASWAARHMVDTYLSFKYHKLSQRREKKKAAMSIAHQILIASYHILRDRTPYKEPVLRQEILLERRKVEILRLENRIRKLKTLASK